MGDSLSDRECNLLKEFLQEQINHVNDVAKLKDDVIHVKIESIEKAVVLAEKVLEARLDKENEIRRQLTEQNKDFTLKFEQMLPRTEYTIEHKNTLSKLNTLEIWKANMEGKASTTQVFIVGIISVLGLILGIIELFTK